METQRKLGWHHKFQKHKQGKILLPWKSSLFDSSFVGINERYCQVSVDQIYDIIFNIALVS